MSEANFDQKKIAIAVITSYPKWYKGKLRSIKHTEKIRGDLALEFVKKTVERGYNIVISDGKSSKTFRRELQTTPNIILTKRKVKSSGEGKRDAIDKASKIPGVEIIVLSEPEKVSLITDCLPQAVDPIFHNKADLVIPKREENLFRSTYPKYMYKSEIEGNGIYNEALRANNILPESLMTLDSFFGPRIFKNDKKVISLFKKKYKFSGMSLLEKLYDPDIYSHVLFFPIVNALIRKLRVVSVEVPFSYPSLQKENEDVGRRDEFIAKRSMQRVSILIDLMHFLGYLQRSKAKL